MHFIQRALKYPMSLLSFTFFRIHFGPFFISLDDFEVTGHVKNGSNSDMDLSLIHVSFDENRENDFLLCENTFEVSSDVLIVTNRLR